jgi:hypothetical protein
MDLSEMVRMADKTDKMIAIVNETVAYYGGDPSRRAYIQHDGDGGVSCVYHADAWAGKPERMCAVGRCLIDPAGLQRKYSSMSVQQLESELGWEFEHAFKPEYRGLPLSFWDYLQNWHDDEQNFHAEGLSERGREEARWLIGKIEKGDFE